MTWTKRIGEISYDYQDAGGEVLANVRMVGIKGRWRWSTKTHGRLERNGWWGTKASQAEATASAEEYMREKGLI